MKTPLDPDVNEEELSLFQINMPGVLTLDEVKALHLENWHLLYHGTFVQMSVRFRPPVDELMYRPISELLMLTFFQDLVGWEGMPMDNPQSLKGIVAELAAVLGPKIVKDSAVVLFD